MYASTYNRTTHVRTHGVRVSRTRTRNYNPSFLPTEAKDAGQEGRIK